jgi:hypothetical protein
MGQLALLICDNLEGPALQVAKVLDFFAVPWKQFDSRSLGDPIRESADQTYCVLCAMTVLGRLLMEQTPPALPSLFSGAESIFLYGGDQSAATQTVLRFLTQCASASLVPIQGTEVLCTVSDQRNDVCGPLSGLRVSVPVSEKELAITCDGLSRAIDPIISTDSECMFGAVSFNGIRCYLAPCPTVIDIADPVQKGYFDIADYFFSAVPLVMYLRHSFGDVMFSPPDNGACLIVDDPVLRPQYGFVDFQRIAEESAKHNFACNVAFIPWNWNRSRSSVVDVFKKYSDRLSISVHGCDHTAQEFGGDSADSMNVQTKLAKSRMEKHRMRTGLQHDQVMVFPQGAFSTVSPKVLKHNGFIAAVNTEVSPLDRPEGTEISDVWRPAILKYSDFAIYTRRYATHGLHNFAFDLLLGKPCLIATHHADFRNEGRDLLEFIDQLNVLGLPLRWRTLGEVIRRAYHRRLRKSGAHEIRMFGNEIIVENASSESYRFMVSKPEHAPCEIDRVEVGGREIAFVPDREFMRFELEVGSRDSTLVNVAFRDIYGDPLRELHASKRIKVAVRRYLSEFRDETEARAPLIYWCALKARKLGGGASTS